MKFYLLIFVYALLLSSAKADWWDSFVEGVSEKLNQGAVYIKETAGPAIREKFNSIKATLQDPETHEKVQTWVKEVSYFLNFKTKRSQDESMVPQTFFFYIIFIFYM